METVFRYRNWLWNEKKSHFLRTGSGWRGSLAKLELRKLGEKGPRKKTV